MALHFRFLTFPLVFLSVINLSCGHQTADRDDSILASLFGSAINSASSLFTAGGTPTGSSLIKFTVASVNEEEHEHDSDRYTEKRSGRNLSGKHETSKDAHHAESDDDGMVVNLNIRQIEVETAGGEWVDAVADDAARSVELKQTKGGSGVDVGLINLNAGAYQRIRITMGDNSTVTFAEDHRTETHPLVIPSQEPNQIILETPFYVPGGDGVYTVGFLIDLDESIKKVESKEGEHRESRSPVSYLFTPRFRIADSATATIAATPPTIIIPNNSPSVFRVQKINLLIPAAINRLYVPVSAVYEIGVDPAKAVLADGTPITADHTLFPGEPAQIHFTYNKAALLAAGLTEDFEVWYFDTVESKWKALPEIDVNTATSTVIAYTDHFTPFVLTAMPSATGVVANPPACLAADQPNGVGGSGGASGVIFSTIGANFNIYRDRNVTVQRNNAFTALGFEQAVAIATCRGGTGVCGPRNQHSQFTGTSYISFTAHTNLDVYVMYDSRGGASLLDTTNDAAWLSTKKFQFTGKIINTNGGAGSYRVYKKTYLAGDPVVLDGNWNGVPNTWWVRRRIRDNYWVVIKRAGVTASEPAASICSAPADVTPPQAITNLTLTPGATQVNLKWTNPQTPDFAGVVIRRSTIAQPVTPGDGVAPTGNVILTESFVDTGLAIGTTYYYTVFALDNNNNYTAVSDWTTTGIDTDGDGLTDTFEKTTDFDRIFFVSNVARFANPAIVDTDGDGIGDGVEVARGTDPTNPDVTPPVVTNFSLKSATPGSNPFVEFNVTVIDTGSGRNFGVNSWMITLTPDPPSSWDPRWNWGTPANDPVNYLLDQSGVYQFYIWVRDWAGNVNVPVAPVTYDLVGINVPKFVYAAGHPVSNYGSNYLYKFQVDLAQKGALIYKNMTPLSLLENQIFINPDGRFMYISNQYYTYAHTLDPSTGSITRVGTWPFGAETLGFHPTQNVAYLAARHSSTTQPSDLRAIEIHPTFGYFTKELQVEVGPVGPDPHDVVVSGGFLYVNSKTSIDAYRINANGTFTGKRTVLDKPGMTYIDFAIDPMNNHAYTWLLPQSLNSGYDFLSEVYNVTDTGLLNLASTQMNIFYGKMTFHPSGKFMYANSVNAKLTPKAFTVYKIGVNGLLTSVQTLPVQVLDSAISKEGNFIYAIDTSNSLIVYAVDQQTGLLTKIQVLPNFVVPAWRHSLEVFSSHDANDPPVANAGDDRWAQMGTAGIALHGHKSYDPDAARCSAVKANYGYSWTLASKPAGSALTTAGIKNGNTLTSASFVADVPGDYTFSLTFTDDPGLCNGTPKSSTDTVVIHAGYHHTVFKNYIDKIGPPPAPQATYTTTLQFDRYKTSYNVFVFTIDPGAPFPALGSFRLLCQTPPVFPEDFGSTQCAILSTTGGYVFLPVANIYVQVQYYYGYWDWWSYQP